MRGAHVGNLRRRRPRSPPQGAYSPALKGLERGAFAPNKGGTARYDLVPLYGIAVQPGRGLWFFTDGGIAMKEKREQALRRALRQGLAWARASCSAAR